MQLQLMPVMELKTEQRMKLEQRLEHKLAQQMELRISLQQYLEQESIIKGLTRWADSNNAWVGVKNHGFEFTYADVPYKLAEPIADQAGPGFAHCVYNSFDAALLDQRHALTRGEWLLFFVKDMIPPGHVEVASEFIPLHERGEEISAGNHFFASQLEFAASAMQKRVREYAGFIDEKYPGKFVDLTQETLFPVLPPELLEHLKREGRRNQQELARAKELIDNHPLPSTFLRLMDWYEASTERVCSAITDCIGPTQERIADFLSSPDSSVGLETAGRVADLVTGSLAGTIRSLDYDDIRVAPERRLNQALQQYADLVSQALYDKIKRHVHILTDFSIAYNQALHSLPLAYAKETIEDQVRLSSEEVKGFKDAV